jgi:hypothetical protein
MTTTVLLFLIPLALALMAFAVLRRRGTPPVRAGCGAIALGVALSLLMAGVLALRELL